jgi:hypothetical protein
VTTPPASGGGVLWPRVNTIGSNGVPNADDSLPPSGTALRQAFETLITVLDDHRIHYAIIGGIATIQHTRVRTTDDIDALLNVAQIAMPAFFESLRESGFDVDVIKSIREFRDEGLTTIRFEDVLVDLMRPILPAYAHSWTVLSPLKSSGAACGSARQRDSSS